MYEALLVVFLVVAIGLVGLIMLQQGKGADMGASFGAGASATLFGSSGSGKSTLLRCINLLEVPDAGEILFNGQNILK